MKVFICSNSFVTRTLLFNIDYLFNFSVEKIILLLENHHSNEKFIFSSKIEVKFNDNIDECLSDCDIIFLIKDLNIPNKIVNYIELRSLQLNKQYIVIDNPWEDYNNKLQYTNNTYTNIINNPGIKKCPVILCISLGITSQPYCLELLLNKIFNQNNIITKQYYSIQTYDLFRQIESADLLNSKILFSNYTSDENNQVYICSYPTNEQMDDEKTCMEFIEKLSPDYIILQTNIKEYDLVNISNILYYNFGTKIDFFIKSQYYDFNGHKVYCSNIKINSSNSPNLMSIESEDLEYHLKQDMLSKIALPESIVAL